MDLGALKSIISSTRTILRNSQPRASTGNMADCQLHTALEIGSPSQIAEQCAPTAVKSPELACIQSSEAIVYTR